MAGDNLSHVRAIIREPQPLFITIPFAVESEIHPVPDCGCAGMPASRDRAIDDHERLIYQTVVRSQSQTEHKVIIFREAKVGVEAADFLNQSRTTDQSHYR